MARTGGKGSIIVNSSIGGSRVTDMMGGEGHGGVYSASKAGADMLMKYAAIEASICICFCEHGAYSNTHNLQGMQIEEAIKMFPA